MVYKTQILHSSLALCPNQCSNRAVRRTSEVHHPYNFKLHTRHARYAHVICSKPQYTG